MHPDLVLIQALWEIDRSADEAKARARSLKEAVGVAQARIEEVGLDRVAVGEEIKRVEETERGLQRELDRYVIRRDRSAELLKGGSALDYLTVQKQLEQCTAKVDELELSVMECMERSDGLAEKAAALQSDEEAATQKHAQEYARWVKVGTEIREELKQLDAQRQAQWADFPRDLHSHYSELRRRNREVVVPIINGSCSACQMTVNAQVPVDLRSGRRVHTCRGCGRYHVLAVDEEVDEA